LPPIPHKEEGPKKTLGQVLLELKKRKEEEDDLKRRQEERVQSQQALAALGITDEMIENTTLDTVGSLLQVKLCFRVKF